MPTIYGTSSNDNLIGTGGDDSIFGMEGNDSLNGGAGNDLLNGGAGDDTLVGGIGNDTLMGLTGADQLIGGAGIDTASYANALAGVTLNFRTGVHAGEAAGDTFDSIEAFRGSASGDTFVSGAEAAVLDGNGGTDTVDYSASTAAVSVNLTTGIGAGGDAAGDTYANIERVVGTAYADTLTSSTAGHVLAGGAGNDVYLVGNQDVRITEAAGEGDDEVRTALTSYSLLGNPAVERL
ncbi:calcium-binding protein, partial [Methylobacterium oryzisoli]